jgi:hypothetical protein
LKILVSASTKKTDIVAELPVEIVNHIIKFLGITDFASCLVVSKPWREKLLSHHVVQDLARIHFPSLQCSNDSDHVSRKSLLEALAKTDRRLSNNFQAVMARPFYLEMEEFFTTEDRYRMPNFDLGQENRPGDEALYDCGRIAWRPREGTSLVVDCLRTQTRKIFFVPSGAMAGRRVRLQALGDRLLVGTIDRLL